MLDPVAELNPLDDLGQPVLAVEFAPFLLGRQHQLVCQCQRGLSAEAALGLGCPMPDGREGALDRVRGSDMLRVLGREVIERQQVDAVLDQAFLSFSPVFGQFSG